MSRSGGRSRSCTKNIHCAGAMRQEVDGTPPLSKAGLCGRFHFAVFDAEVGAVAGEEAPGVVDGLADADADVGGDFVGG